MLGPGVIIASDLTLPQVYLKWHPRFCCRMPRHTHILSRWEVCFAPHRTTVSVQEILNTIEDRGECSSPTSRTEKFFNSC